MKDSAPRRSRARRALAAGLCLLAVLGTGCLAGSGANRGIEQVMALPHSAQGALLFVPADGAAAVPPDQPVLVHTRYSDARLVGVSVTAASGAAITGSVDSAASFFHTTAGLQPDATYTVTALVSLPQAASPGPVRQETDTVTFTTATTPKVVGVSPTVVAPGEPVVVTLSQPAREASVAGPVSSDLDEGGTHVRLYPTGYHQGATYSVTLTATSRAGVVGRPQALRFAALGGPTISVSPANGASDIGVAMPFVVTLSQPPANPASFAGLFSATADVTSGVPGPSAAPPAPAPAGVTPVVPVVSPSGAPAADPCPAYAPAPAAGGAVALTARWLNPTRLQLTPKTVNGYWPPGATIVVTAPVDGVAAQDGSWFSGTVQRLFRTGSQRVIDVDLSTQTLSACRDGRLDNQFLVSTGTTGRETPTGSYYIYDRILDATMTSGGNPFAPDYYNVKNVPFTQYFHNGDALHGAWWHNNFGHPMSHGCVNVPTPTHNAQWPHAAPDAEYLWHFDNLGDPVIVHGTTPA